MRTLHVHDTGTGELVDIVTVTAAGTAEYETGAGREALETVTAECTARGIPAGGRALTEALTGRTVGDTRWSTAPAD